jgi:hypothetical protein
MPRIFKEHQCLSKLPYKEVDRRRSAVNTTRYVNRSSIVNNTRRETAASLLSIPVSTVGSLLSIAGLGKPQPVARTDGTLI